MLRGVKGGVWCAVSWGDLRVVWFLQVMGGAGFSFSVATTTAAAATTADGDSWLLPSSSPLLLEVEGSHLASTSMVDLGAHLVARGANSYFSSHPQRGSSSSSTSTTTLLPSRSPPADVTSETGVSTSDASSNSAPAVAAAAPSQQLEQGERNTVVMS